MPVFTTVFSGEAPSISANRNSLLVAQTGDIQERLVSAVFHHHFAVEGVLGAGILKRRKELFCRRETIVLKCPLLSTVYAFKNGPSMPNSPALCRTVKAHISQGDRHRHMRGLTPGIAVVIR